MQRQLRQFQTRQTEIRQQLEHSEAPLEDNKASLGQQLQVRIEVEEELAVARKKVENVEAELRELDQSRMQIDQSVDDARQMVSEAEMSVQEIRVRREGLAEQLSQTDFELEALLEQLDESAEVDTWEEKLEKVRRRIDRLGPINLAAIDEFKEQSERKEYLDSQLADLNDALATLEGAIRKIDKETRTRFRETYDNINEGFQRLFPKLFGGGHAYLEFDSVDGMRLKYGSPGDGHNVASGPHNYAETIGLPGFSVTFEEMNDLYLSFAEAFGVPFHDLGSED